jgi:tripartite-type tricarboxylate transporter receptor subunit TctC
MERRIERLKILRKSISLFLHGIATLVGVVAALPVFAQSAFPVKPVRLLVGFSPGGGQDIAGRILGKYLAASWGQPVIVENRAGANGMIAAEAVANAAPEGYTLHVFTANDTVNAGTRAKMPFDTLRDLAPVTAMSSSPYLLGVHPALPEVRETFLGMGTEPRSSTPEAFGNQVKSEIIKWAALVKAIGLKLD